jgi:predicted dinucleotide-binding enzyme
MQVAVLGTGVVGRTLAGKLAELGHELRIGSRTADEERGCVAFADAAAFGEIVVNATAGTASLDALAAAGAENLAGKVLIDVANPLDVSGGMPPKPSVCNDDSLGERIQREFASARVVKALNTVNAEVMVDPGSVPGEHVIFVCGDDAEAKALAIELLGELGWPPERVLDLGDISAARGTEMYLPLWLRLMGALGTPSFNIAIAR